MLPANSAASLFATLHSAYMRLIRESCAFAGAGRAALLQLAHPYVAAGVSAHSSIGADGAGVQTRFYRTFFYMFRLAFGEREVALRAARAVRRRAVACPLCCGSAVLTPSRVTPRRCGHADRFGACTTA